MKNMNYCQSCGMPMEEGCTEILGTNLDGSKNEEYCTYCFQNGEFTTKGTMEEMRDICVMHMVQENNNMTKEMATKIMDEYLPKLKRWK